MNSRTGSLIGQSSDNDFRIALHYEDAAKILYESNAYQDGIVLPVLFLIRQYLELILKYNIRKLNKISSCNDLITRLNREHGLVKIHGAFIAHYNSVKALKNITDTKDAKYLSSLKDLVSKISILDSGSQGFRYSENRDGEKIIDPQEMYDLEETFDLLEKISDFISSIEEMQCL
jgi:hypothetical protein